MDLQSLYKDIGNSYGTGKYSNINSLDSLFNLYNNNTNILNTNNTNNNILEGNITSPVSQQQSVPSVDVNWDDYLGKLSQYQTSQAEQNKQNLLTDSPMLTSIKQRTAGTLTEVPKTQQEFLDYFGKTPEGGWNDQNTYGGKQDVTLQGWLQDPTLLPKFDLYGSGSQEDLQKGFNVLQHYAPRNIGEFWNLSPDVQKAMLQHPEAALTYMQKIANPANEDWLSTGAEGGFTDPSAYMTTASGNLTVDPRKYQAINDSGGLLGGIFNVLDPVLDTIDPLHNTLQDTGSDLLGFKDQKQAFSTVAPMVLDMFFPGVGSAVSAADAVSRGDMMSAILSGASAGMGLSGTSPSLTGTPWIDNAIVKGGLSGLGTANRGGSLGDIFRDTALGGLSSFNTGNMLADYLNVSQPMGNVLSSAGMNAINQLARNGELDPAQMAIAIGKAGLNNYMKG